MDGRKVDSWFSPGVGMIAAALVCLWALSTSGTLLFAVNSEIGRAVGLIDPPAFTVVDGRVEAITAQVPMPKNKVAQDLTISYQAGNQRPVFDDSRIVRRDEAVSVGDTVQVYLVDGVGPTLDRPHDRALDVIIAALAAGVSLVLLYLAQRYFRYRYRIFQARPLARPYQPLPGSTPRQASPKQHAIAPQQPVALRGSAKPLSTEARMKADAERVRRAGSR